MKRPWVTPEEVIEYTSHEDVKQRSAEKLTFDIFRAEQKVIKITNNRFNDEKLYPDIPKQVKTAVILLAEAYAKNAIEATKTQIKSETFDDYSYTAESATIDIGRLDLEDLLSDFVIAKGTDRVFMRLRSL